MVGLSMVVATAVAVVVSGVYYGMVPSPAPDDPVPQPSMGALLLVELLRNSAVAALVAGLLSTADWSGLGAGGRLGLALWVLPAVLLAGSSFHEGVPLRRAAVHAGDWLIKLVVIGAAIGLMI